MLKKDKIRLLDNKRLKKNILNQVVKNPILENVNSLLRMEQLYEAGIKEIRTKLEILDSEFKVKYDHNPIHHIESRLKKPESIIKKAIDKDVTLTEKEIMRHIHDIAGIRVICNYIDDVYVVAQLLINQDDIKLIKIKDYIQNPKDNGYRSLHLVLEVPIFLAEGVQPIHVEVQLRTIAMDFWASLEHKLKYKTDNNVPEDIKKELIQCAMSISELDYKMQSIHNCLNNDSEIQ
ncbi:MAG: GTP pyrophosphokinase family protein [Coprobacillus cateniformis]